MSAREATLGWVALSFARPLAVGAMLAWVWSAQVMDPLARASLHDVPGGLSAIALLLLALGPLVLYVRRHALDASVRWDDQAITLLRGGRVATSIAWSQASVRTETSRRGRVVQIADDTRSITLASGRGLTPRWLEGKRLVAARKLDEILATATARQRPVTQGLVRERARGLEVPLDAMFAWWLVNELATYVPAARLHGHALTALGLGAALLVPPIHRLFLALRRPAGSEILLLDTEERGRLRARRLLDGTRVLLDVTPARHPDALLATRRGFVNAVLAIPTFGTGTTYRAAEEPIPATYVETRDDRVLRFEALRAALVDLVGYGAFLATALLAVMLTA